MFCRGDTIPEGGLYRDTRGGDLTGNTYGPSNEYLNITTYFYCSSGKLCVDHRYISEEVNIICMEEREKVMKRALMLLVVSLTTLTTAWAQQLGIGPNKDNLPFGYEFVVPTAGVPPSQVTYVQFEGVWVPDAAKDEYKEGKGVVNKSLFKCYKKEMFCSVVTLTLMFLKLDLDTISVKEWNSHRIVIEDDVSPGTPCPVVSTTVIDFDRKLIVGSEAPLVARWQQPFCKDTGWLTPEVAMSTETLAALGGGHFFGFGH
jgi:hypothetical protein